MRDDYTHEELWVINHAEIGKSKIVCPWCPPREKRNRADLSTDNDGERIVYNCWHDPKHNGIIVTREEGAIHRPRSARPEPKRETIKMDREFPPLTDRHYKWLADRKISRATVEKFKLFAARKYIHATEQREDCIAIPYFDEKGEIDHIKFRSIESKNFLSWQAAKRFYNIWNVKPGEDIIIVEGEMDALACDSAGITALSCPNGAPKEVSEEGKVKPEDDLKFAYVWNAKDHIDAAKKIVMAVDMDGPGDALAEELARRCSKAKSWRVKWTGGKDANDVLLALGHDALRGQIENAEPWPVAGLYDVEHFRFDVEDLFINGVGKGKSTNYPDVDELYMVHEGMLTIVTGIPSSGKSEFIDQIMINVAQHYGWRFCICSFENAPKFHIAKLAAKLTKRQFFTSRYNNRMTNEDLSMAVEWLHDHFVFCHQDDGGLSNIDSIIERIRTAVMRYGVRGAVIDPYNYIERQGDNEVQWISDMLTKLKVFASAYGLHIWLIAHPQKLMREKNGKYKPPGGYDISGAAHWFNKADHGLTVHREKEDPTLVQIISWKSRFSWMGRQGEAVLIYDQATTNYVSTEEEDPYENHVPSDNGTARYSSQQQREPAEPDDIPF